MEVSLLLGDTHAKDVPLEPGLLGEPHHVEPGS